MIKIGIEGAGSAEAGELIRLLINHPDVELEQICQPEYSGRRVSDLHHGLQGESDLVFCSSLNTDELDIIFVTSNASTTAVKDYDSFIASKGNGDDYDSGFVVWLAMPDSVVDMCAPYYLKVADGEGDVSDNVDENVSEDDWSEHVVFGVPELNRKPMVRGARRAVIPTAVESLAAISLLPVNGTRTFFNSLLINVEAASDIVDELQPRVAAICERLSKMVSTIYMRTVEVSLRLQSDLSTRRCMRLKIQMETGTTVEEVSNLFRSIYDDHNMTHLSDKNLSFDEVEGTNNCLVAVDMPVAGVLSIEAIADARLRGGAGEAVHVMNLFAGLFEKTGLNLKASNY